MNYKETLFFVGKSLTIPHDEKNYKEISYRIEEGEVNWEEVVKLSTSHYVFTTLYCLFQRAELLSFLPEDLVSYMKHLTELNRDRNQQIIEQATELNTILRQNDIQPIFLKGTGNLLQGLYDDIGERMVGDIDFIIRPEDYNETIKILKEYGYQKVFDRHSIPGKHYPRSFKEGSVAAIEIHKEMVKNPFEPAFNYETIKGHIISKNGFSVLSYEHQLSLAVIALQINDDGQYYNTISLRNAYDVFCLSQKVDASSSIKELDQIFHPLNNFLALCNYTLSDGITYNRTEEAKKYLAKFDKLLNNQKFRLGHHRKWKRKLYFRSRLKITLKSLYKKEYSIWLIKTVTSPRWLKAKFKSGS